MPPPAHIQFINTMRRRMIAHRLIESALVGFCVGCLIVAVSDRLLPLEQGWLGALGAMVALLIYLVRRWPSMTMAIDTIDSQLHWHELLRSAVAPFNEKLGENLAPAVRAVADAHCRSARISDLSLSRISVRRTIWAMIVLLISAALWIAPHSERINSQPSSQLAQQILPALDQPPPALQTAVPHVLPSANQNDAREASNRHGMMMDSTPVQHQRAIGHARGSNHSAGGVGAGFARTSAQIQTPPPPDLTSMTANIHTSLGTSDGGGASETDPLQSGKHRANPRGQVLAAKTTDHIASSFPQFPNEPNQGSLAHTTKIPNKDADLVKAFFSR